MQNNNDCFFMRAQSYMTIQQHLNDTLADLDTELLDGVAPAEQARLSMVNQSQPFASRTAGLVSANSTRGVRAENIFRKSVDFRQN